MNQNKTTAKKRLTKKDIYARYGIEYDGNGHIYHNVLGWIPCVLIDGNEKIGKGVWHFSTLPTNDEYTFIVNGIEYTEKGTCPCHCVGCYATVGNYRYESTITSNGIKTWLVRHDIDFLYRAISAQIKADKIRLLRVHASGDFCSEQYINMWKRISTENGNVTMWTYTKNPIAENAFDDIQNFNVVKSVIAGKGFNFGHCDYILALYEYLKSLDKKVYICRCGIDKNQHCVNCSHCATSDYVLFIEHSTEYKAEKDPLFPILKALIESQNGQAA